jgi:hypothetical protein
MNATIVAMSDIDIRRSLFNWKEADTVAEVPSAVQHIAMDQYRLYVDLTDRLSQRRQTASSFFISATTAVVAVLGYANNARAQLLVSVAGMILCVLWWRIIKSYRDLNRARFAVIYAIETLLPIRPYTAEWDYVGRGQSSGFYKSVSGVEAYVPMLFFLLFLAVLVWTLAR